MKKKNVLLISMEQCGRERKHSKLYCHGYNRDATASDTASKNASREMTIQFIQYSVQTLACLFNLLNNRDVSEGEKNYQTPLWRHD